jgi:hypothetical protein
LTGFAEHVEHGGTVRLPQVIYVGDYNAFFCKGTFGDLCACHAA